MYFANYARLEGEGVRLALGFLERRPAIFVHDASDAPSYFILLEFAGDRVTRIRDFRNARYAMEGAEILLAD